MHLHKSVNKQGPILSWVVALRSEAKPIIETFRLSRVESASQLFPVYASKTGEVELVICGPGKVNAAAATAVLASLHGEKNVVRGWINFGIAGAGLASYGTAFLCSTVTDQGSGRSWYPSATCRTAKRIPRAACQTVDIPESEYPRSGTVFEMEAAGFYPIALKDASAELCQVIKVISDDPEHPIGDISKPIVEGLCQQALVSIGDWLEEFREILAEEALLQQDPESFRELCGAIRFTVTQQHQLRRLLQQWIAVRLEGEELPPVPAQERASGSIFLKTLEKLVLCADRNPVSRGNVLP